MNQNSQLLENLSDIEIILYKVFCSAVEPDWPNCNTHVWHFNGLSMEPSATKMGSHYLPHSHI